MEPGDAEEYVTGPPEYLRELLDKIDTQLRWLPSLSGKVARSEQLDLDSKLRIATLPGSRVVEKLVRSSDTRAHCAARGPGERIAR
jgi:hypothetical protein